MLKLKDSPALCSGLWMGKQSLFFFSVPLINLSFWSSQGFHILGWYKCVWLSKLGIGLCSVLSVCGPIYLIFVLNCGCAHTSQREAVVSCEPWITSRDGCRLSPADLVQVAHSLIGAEREGCRGKAFSSSDGFSSVDIFIALLELGLCCSVRGQ